jgi:hypothetical protein
MYLELKGEPLNQIPCTIGVTTWAYLTWKPHFLQSLREDEGSVWKTM